MSDLRPIILEAIKQALLKQPRMLWMPQVQLHSYNEATLTGVFHLDRLADAIAAKLEQDND